MMTKFAWLLMGIGRPRLVTSNADTDGRKVMYFHTCA